MIRTLQNVKSLKNNKFIYVKWVRIYIIHIKNFNQVKLHYSKNMKEDWDLNFGLKVMTLLQSMIQFWIIYITREIKVIESAI